MRWHQAPESSQTGAEQLGVANAVDGVLQRAWIPTDNGASRWEVLSVFFRWRDRGHDQSGRGRRDSGTIGPRASGSGGGKEVSVT